MKKLIITFIASTSFVIAQDDAPKVEPAPAAGQPEKPNADADEPEKPQYVIDLEALSEEDAKKYLESFRRADYLFKQKRIFECLEAVEEIHSVYDKNPGSLNLKGACYVEFRAFDKARIAFAKALKSSPGNFNVRFNLAEIEFVTENYEKSLEILEGLKKEAAEEKQSLSMLPLVEFKMLLCKIKTDDMEGAEAIVAKKDFLDDSPLFYYGNAALEYAKDNGAKAEVWLARAGRIFRSQNGALLAPWQDTLIEFGYIKSFYGGDLDVEGENGGE